MNTEREISDHNNNDNAFSITSKHGKVCIETKNLLSDAAKCLNLMSLAENTGVE